MDEGRQAAALVRVEAAALEVLAQRLDDAMGVEFGRALRLLERCAGRVVVTGVGKSGLIGRKIAATLCSTGCAAVFLHAGEAAHGDLGVLRAGDVVLAVSYSGETDEVVRLLPALGRLGVKVVSLCGCAGSTLAQASAVWLNVSVAAEACELGLAPTTSTTVMLALGDALAVQLSRMRGFEPSEFGELHPGGLLGRRLERVRNVMHVGDAVPLVSLETNMVETMHEMSQKKLGMTVVVDEGRLAGVISDGDLRRLLEREGGAALAKTAGEVMNSSPVTIVSEALSYAALRIMEERKITGLVVVREDAVEGVIHLHDLWRGLTL